MHKTLAYCLLAHCALALTSSPLSGQQADRILLGGKVVTVDRSFSVAEAVAIRGDRIMAVGTNAEIRSMAGSETVTVELNGKMVLPGLIDSHVHAADASIYEYDHPVPDVASVEDVLAYIESRAQTVEPGAWIRVQQMFVTRLKERRFPTREELDAVAPNNPVIFRTGPDMAVNSLALQLSGVDESYQLPPGESGRLERDESGRLNGIIRGASQIIRFQESQRDPSAGERRDLIKRLFRDYNSVGITSISDRNVSDSVLALYSDLASRQDLTVRIFMYYGIDPDRSPAVIREKIEQLAGHPLHAYNDRLWLRGIKVFLDGGMLTGSAYMRQPWGVSDIYSITDPAYRGTLKIQPERLYQIAYLALSNEFQMTAHAVGDAAIDHLIDAYELAGEELDIRSGRPCITHCNFLHPHAIQRMAQLGIVADLQPAWLYLDGVTLEKQFGNARLKHFQPYQSLFEAGVVVGGGSDHMQKIGSLRSINPYNPFLGMWVAIERIPRGASSALHPEQKLTREQAIRLYTINNAFLAFEENVKGSIEAGKLADIIVIDRDLLNCPSEQIPETKVLETYLGGKVVYHATE